MTLTLTLTPEKEARLAEQALAAGMTLDDYAQNVIDLAAAPLRLETPEQKASSFLEWARAQNLNAPALPLEAVSREALYAGDDEDAENGAERSN